MKTKEETKKPKQKQKLKQKQKQQNSCQYCGEPVKGNTKYCSDECYIADKN